MHLLFGFSGRIGRGQWWLAQAAMLGLGLCALVILAAGTGPYEKGTNPLSTMSIGAVLAMAAVFALMTWINIAATVKRFHDRNKPGIWFLMTFVPYVGSLWILVECGFLSGTPGSNDFGSPGGSGRSSGLDDYDIEGVTAASRRAHAVPKPAGQASPRPAAAGRGSVPSFGRRTA